MALDLLSFTRTWLSAEDFPTIEPDEATVRKDLQFHPDAIKKYLNEVVVPAIDSITANGVKSPGKLVFSGAVTATYTGEQDVNVKIPVGSGGETTATVTIECSVDPDGTTVTFGDLPTGYVNAFTLASDAYNSGQSVQLVLTNGSQGHSLYLAQLSEAAGAQFVGYCPAEDGIGAVVVTVRPEGDGKYSETAIAGAVTGTTPPTSSTVGTVGQQYVDTTNKRVWYCTAVSDSGYTWISPDKELADLIATKQNSATAITTSNIGSQTVNKAKYATDTIAVGTPALRNQYFVSAETTPTVNGQIAWVYG